MKDYFQKYLLFIVLCLSVILFVVVYANLNGTVEDYAKKILEDKMEQTESKLENFFNPVIENIHVAKEQGKRMVFDSLELEDFNSHFFPLVEESDPISSMMLADEQGEEIMLLHLDDKIVNRQTYSLGENDSLSSIRYQWDINQYDIVLDSSWKDSKYYDPKTRPWFQQAINGEYDSVYWTAPYTFFTTKDPGITASVKWKGSNGKDHILGFDLMLLDISKFTTQFEVTKNGTIFILTDDNRVLGLPSADKFKNEDSLKLNILKPVESVSVSSMNAGYIAWTNAEKKDFYIFEDAGHEWRGMGKSYQLGNQKFTICLIAPEKDFLESVKTTKFIIIIGFILILVFSLFVTKAYSQKNRLNSELHEKNILVEEKSHMVEEKNKEILDSINYAKRIQNAILPPDKLFKQTLENAFILYKPKDIVAGDFYWMETVNNDTTGSQLILFAAADCTGHGVPGAMVSVLCNNALNRSVREYNLIEPGDILDKTREIVVEEFSKSEEEVKDGMDIALCSLVINNDKHTLKYSGAHNPLWIVRKGDVIEVKANKQPVGKFDNPEPYTTHEIELIKGDVFYIFSDGFSDQFGGDRGKKFKSAKFKKLLISINNETIQRQKELIDSAFEEWKGDFEQLDDVCVIGVKI